MVSSCELNGRNKLYSYQEKAISFAVYSGRCGLFLSPGLGKTVIALTVIKDCQREKRRWLVVCPLRVMGEWIKEIDKWSHLENLTSVIIHGKNRERYLSADADIYIINYENLKWLFDYYKDMRGRGMPFSHLILDESQKIKSQSTKRWRCLRKMLPAFDRRILLTGTPLGGGALEGLWTQMFVIDNGVSFGTAFTRFREKYFHNPGFNVWDWRLKKGAEEKIYEKIRPYCLSMRHLDYIKMPKLIRNKIPVRLDQAANELYKDCEKEFYIDWLGDVVIPETAAIKGLKLRQITQGGFYNDDQKWLDVHDRKYEALADLIDELNGSPLLVIYHFNGELENIKKIVPNAPVIGGGLSKSEHDQIIDDWNNDRIPVLLGHPKSIGLGLNLQYGSACNICWTGPTWSLEEHIQVEARLWRQGQKQTVIVHHLMATGTIDETIINVLTKKDATQNDLFNAIKLRGKKI